jgi:hypothetical protein
MFKTGVLATVALGICSFTVVTSTASAIFKGSTTTGKGKGGQGVLTLENGKAFPNYKCTTGNGRWTIQKADTKQEPVLEGGHLLALVKQEGKPKGKTTTGNCDANVSEETTLEAEVKIPQEIQLQQLTKGATTNLVGKLNQDSNLTVVGAACKLFWPSKSNQNLGKFTIENTESKNLSIKPEVVGKITMEAIGAGCAAAGLKNSTTGSMNLEPGQTAIAEGVIEI